MKILILGAGLEGVCTAWYLARSGHQITVVERHQAPAQETSFANGSQISVSHPEPWANPSAPMQVLRWLGRPDAPLLFRPQFDWHQWQWGLAFLRECLPSRTAKNTQVIASLAKYSQQQLQELRAELGLEYQQLEKGILHLFFDAQQFAKAQHHLETLHQHQITGELVTREQCFEIEPNLNQNSPLYGGLYAPTDESGNAQAFCTTLAQHCTQQGVEFRYSCQANKIITNDGKFVGVEVTDAQSSKQQLSADACVVALGSYSRQLALGIGESLPIYPVKGYSITVPVKTTDLAPQTSLTDEARRIVCSRLGNFVRVAGTAELNGFDLSLPEKRWKPLAEWLEKMFPGACELSQAVPWCGLRPATPTNIPVIGRAKIDNIFFNTGHGTLGWTLACGSAKLTADLINRQNLAIEFPVRNRA